MKIESYDVKTEANSDYTFEQKHSSEFKTLLINSKIDTKDKIHKENIVRLEVAKLEKVLLSDGKDLSHQDRIKKNILEIILNNFTNEKDLKLYPIDKETNTTRSSEKNEKLTQIKESTFKHLKEYHQESSVEYNTQAFIKTNRGQINIDLKLSFSQEFYEKHETIVKTTKTIYLDPLIINYDSNLTSFDNISSTMNFAFDLNNDGDKESIPKLKEGTGFLALDKDKNGTIDNGNELFGANTGDGFEELRTYDEDKNNWIDENDSIFNNLLIWEKNEKGNNSLVSLGQAGIGAIYLSAVDSGFTYSSGIQEDYARLKQSSFHVKENGEVGLVTSVDFAT